MGYFLMATFHIYLTKLNWVMHIYSQLKPKHDQYF